MGLPWWLAPTWLQQSSTYLRTFDRHWLALGGVLKLSKGNEEKWFNRCGPLTNHIPAVTWCSCQGRRAAGQFLLPGLHFWFTSPGEFKITSGEFHFRIFTGGEFDHKVFRPRKLQKEPRIINCYKYFDSFKGHIPYSKMIIQIGILHTFVFTMVERKFKKGTLGLLENGFKAM